MGYAYKNSHKGAYTVKLVVQQFYVFFKDGSSEKRNYLKFEVPLGTPRTTGGMWNTSNNRKNNNRF